MNTLWPSRASGDGAAASDRPPAGPEAEGTNPDSADSQSADSAAPASDSPKRPSLQRHQLAQAEAPPLAPFPPASSSSSAGSSGGSDGVIDSARDNGSPAPLQAQQAGLSQDQSQDQGRNQPQVQQQQQQQHSQDSLSLAQLRRIVAEFPHSEPVAYDYVYTDMGPLDEEVDEWFTYNFWQWVRLNAANRAFQSAWTRLFPPRPGPGSGPSTEGAPSGVTWEGDDDDNGDDDNGGPGAPRRLFVRRMLEGLRSADRAVRAEAVGAVVYVVLGRWSETVKAVGVLTGLADGKKRSAATQPQLRAMKEGVRLVAECGGIEIVWEALRKQFELFW